MYCDDASPQSARLAAGSTVGPCTRTAYSTIGSISAASGQERDRGVVWLPTAMGGVLAIGAGALIALRIRFLMPRVACRLPGNPTGRASSPVALTEQLVGAVGAPGGSERWHRAQGRRWSRRGRLRGRSTRACPWNCSASRSLRQRATVRVHAPTKLAVRHQQVGGRFGGVTNAEGAGVWGTPPTLPARV